jgi:hypothetical protein
MEQKFGKNSIDIKALREFCEREGKEVTYRKGDQLEREVDPARWFGFVTEGCFKYVTYGISDDIAVGTGTWGIAAVIPKYCPCDYCIMSNPLTK